MTLLRRPASAWRVLQGLGAARPTCLGLRPSSSTAHGTGGQQAGAEDDGQSLLAYWRGLLDDRQRPRGTAGAALPLPESVAQPPINLRAACLRSDG